jgi:hypothetical protein
MNATTDDDLARLTHIGRPLIKRHLSGQRPPRCRARWQWCITGNPIPEQYRPRCAKGWPACSLRAIGSPQVSIKRTNPAPAGALKPYRRRIRLHRREVDRDPGQMVPRRSPIRVTTIPTPFLPPPAWRPLRLAE